MEDIRNLESTVVGRSGRSKYVPHDAAVALGAYVCPRADNYGSRHHVISPAVAVTHDLVPRRLVRVSVDTATHHGRIDDENPLSAEEQYRRYYGQADVRSPDGAGGTGAQAVGAVGGVPAAPVPPPAATPPVAPPAPSAGPVVFEGTTGEVPPAVSAAVPEAPAGRPVAPAVGVRVFSGMQDGLAETDTLDGFYASLGRHERREPGVRSERRGQAARAHAELGPADVPTPPPPQDGRVAELERQVADLSSLASQWHDEAERRGAALRQSEREMAKLAEAAPASDGPMRLVLGQEDEKVRVEGRHWSCNVMGHLCWSRSRSELALVVPDVGYASEMLAEAESGECVVATAAGRTPCRYAGRCDKIYGEAGSREFIAVFRFSCVPAARE